MSLPYSFESKLSKLLIIQTSTFIIRLKPHKSIIYPIMKYLHLLATLVATVSQAQLTAPSEPQLLVDLDEPEANATTWVATFKMFANTCMT
jgi:hypothetical protein